MIYTSFWTITFDLLAARNWYCSTFFGRLAILAAYSSSPVSRLKASIFFKRPLPFLTYSFTIDIFGLKPQAKVFCFILLSIIWHKAESVNLLWYLKVGHLVIVIPSLHIWYKPFSISALAEVNVTLSGTCEKSYYLETN